MTAKIILFSSADSMYQIYLIQKAVFVPEIPTKRPILN